MKSLLALLLLLLGSACSTSTDARGLDDDEAAAAKEAVAAVLDDFHRAAAAPDGDRYFGLFAPGAIFFGTAGEERWTVEEFRAYAEPYFAQGRGWLYVPRSRTVELDGDGETAWFDEVLENDSYGTVRGTGVLVQRDGSWRITQYHLALPVPNEFSAAVVRANRGELVSGDCAPAGVIPSSP